MIGVKRRTKECFIYTTATDSMVEGKLQSPKETHDYSQVDMSKKIVVSF